jgi:uncharacterized protein YndB with AHSA1/START domain
MTDIDSATTTVEQAVHIDASPATVWAFWTDPQRLTEWWAQSAEVEPQPGGLYRVVMANGHISRGEFVELDPFNRLVFTFGWEQEPFAGALRPGSTTVEVSLRPEAGGTDLVLRHTLPVTHAEDHRKGWAGLVGDRLVAAAAAGG